MELVDWALAASIGRRIAPDGPDLSITEAADAVHQLRELAAAAVEPVAHVSELVAAADGNVAVVDRPMWIDSNLGALEVVTGPLLETVAERATGANPLLAQTGAKASGVQLGAALGWMSGKVLGQYEAFPVPGSQPQLLLVAPNIVAAERAMAVPSRDFRFWVCLHEEAHRVQFGAVPWLSDHFTAEVHSFLAGSDLSTGDAIKRFGELAKTIVKVISGDENASIVEAAQTPAQRVVFTRLTALMSLLEGHAEWVMDAVGPSQIPSLALLRERFDQRRTGQGAGDSLLRRLMGMDTKLRQYIGGRAFVSAVVAEVGVAGFNQVWTSPQTLPTLPEIHEPHLWVQRVHGAA